MKIGDREFRERKRVCLWWFRFREHPLAGKYTTVIMTLSRRERWHQNGGWQPAAATAEPCNSTFSLVEIAVAGSNMLVGGARQQGGSKPVAGAVSRRRGGWLGMVVRRCCTKMRRRRNDVDDDDEVAIAILNKIKKKKKLIRSNLKQKWTGFVMGQK